MKQYAAWIRFKFNEPWYRYCYGSRRECSEQLHRSYCRQRSPQMSTVILPTNVHPNPIQLRKDA